METSGNQTVSSIGFALHKVNSPSYNLINYHINADLPNLSYGSMQALSFNGIQNDKIVFRVATFYSSINFVVEVYAPNGNLIRQQQTSNNVIRVDNLTLPQNGIYTILVMEKTGNQSVSSIGYSLQKVNSPNITLTPINSNTLMPDLNTYAAIHPLAFNATANDRITFRLGGETAPPQYQVEIYTPTGILLDMKQTSTGYIRFDSLILPATGIYTILVMDDDGKDQSFFGYGVSLQKVNQAAISLTPINANVPMPALDYGFINPIAVNVEAGDRIMLRLGAGTTTPQYQIEIYDPLGRQVAIKNTTTGYIRFDSMTLTTSGVYTFLIMEKLGLIQTGSNFGVSIQKTNSPTISRTAINANIAMPNLSYGFTQPIAVNVQSGDKIALRLGSFSATPQYQVEVYDPAGRQVAISETKTGYLRFNNMTLSETGIYTFLIMDKFGRQTVSTGYGISIQKVNTPNITLTTYNTNDAPSLLDYGAINPLTFNALVGERATFRVSSSSNSFNFQIELYDASGNFIVTRTGTNGSLRIDSFTIAQSGRYTLLYMESNGRQTVTSFGTSLQRRTNLPNNPTVLISQQTVSATFSQYSQITPYVFTAKAGDNFGVTMSSNFSSVRPRMELFGPDGTLLRFGTASSSLGFNSIRLSQTGQFVLWAMDDNGRNSGDYLLNYQLIVGTKEINEVKSVQVMPNPATTICQIEYEAKGGEKADFMIFTEGGVLASAVRGIVCKANKNLLSCDVSNLAAGVYVCRLQVDGATSVRRLVVVH